MVVVRLCGPAAEGKDRMRWQVTFPSGTDQVTIRRDEARALAAAIIRSLDPLKYTTAHNANGEKGRAG